MTRIRQGSRVLGEPVPDLGVSVHESGNGYYQEFGECQSGVFFAASSSGTAGAAVVRVHDLVDRSKVTLKKGLQLQG